MRLNDATIQRLWNITEPVCAGAGYELVDLALTQTSGGWVLRVFIDHPPHAADAAEAPGGALASSIGFDDCERVSRELGAVLDVEDPIAHAYSLEVSSPGLDRPIRKLEHFERYVGQVVKVTLGVGLAGRRNFKGTLRAVERSQAEGGGGLGAAGATIAIDVDGTEYRLPFSDIENARLVPDWDALFQRGHER